MKKEVHIKLHAKSSTYKTTCEKQYIQQNRYKPNLTILNSNTHVSFRVKLLGSLKLLKL